MVFASLTFLFCFLPLVLAVHAVLPWRPLRNAWLCAASVLFYAWGEPRYVALILVSMLGNWAVALALSRLRRGRRALLAAGVALNLAAIGVFKYAGFLVENLNAVLPHPLPVPQLSLPIGISFYTFQALSYLVDVYRGTVTVEPNPLYFSTYLCLFPQLIAGPIVRYETVQADLRHRRCSLADFAGGTRRFIVGLGKKVLLANTMGLVCDRILLADPCIGALAAWYAMVAYAFQIYFDFSGYSDMAIGLGRMLGFHFLENFEYPYVATSITEFWRRWHISLSTFFRDYLYIPLGGNRVSPLRWAANLMIVWSLTGLWHGASWNFVLWGTYYGLLLLGEKLIWGRLLQRLPRLCRHACTLAAVLIGWVIFRLESYAQITGWLASLAGARGFGSPATLDLLNVLHLYPWFVVAAIASTPLGTRTAERIERLAAGSLLVDLCLLAVLAASIGALLCGGFNPFIYFRF